MNAHVLATPIRYWKCPSCHQTDQTQRIEPETRMHSCPAMGGMTVPFVQVADPNAALTERHVLVEREDYIGTEVGVGRYMAVRTERPDGSYDCAVYAPTATVRGEGLTR